MEEVEQAADAAVEPDRTEQSHAAEPLPEPQRENEDAQESLFIAEAIRAPQPLADSTVTLKAIIEAAIYVTDEPLSAEQIATAVGHPLETVKTILDQLSNEYAAPDRGLLIREIAGGYVMATKPEHHESIRLFVRRLQPPLKLSMAALETLAVIAYKQPVTAPEIMEIRGVQGAGVLKTLLDRKLVSTAGRKNVIGKPITYKTTREFLIQFGLSSLAELPTLKEFEDIGRLALSDSDGLEPAAEPVNQRSLDDEGEPPPEELGTEPDA